MNPISVLRYGSSHGSDHEDAVLWDVTVRGQVDRYRRFGGTSVMFLSLKMEAMHSS